jgi:hypothetical protein
MSYFTAKQISDLNNSMVAAQSMQLGTVIDGLVAGGSTVNKVVTGSFTPAAAVTQINTGLAHVTGVTISMTGSPSVHLAAVTANSASAAAGYIYVYCWSGSANANTGLITYAAASGSSILAYPQLCWIATGHE